MKSKVLRIVCAAVLLVAALLVEHTTLWPVWALFLVYLVPYLVAGYDVVLEAIEGICHSEGFDEDVLMTIATLGALGIGFLPGASHEFPEAVFVMLFFQVGELFEHFAEHSSKRSISALMDLRPDVAHVLREGRVEAVSPSAVAIGEHIVVRPGERVPLDGRVVEGASSVDTVALTGESVPRRAAVGDGVLSGCVNLSGVLTIEVEKVFEESAASRIIRLVEDAGQSKSGSERFITRFARVYTPVVCGAAFVLAVVPPLVMGNFAEQFPTWLYRALTFLVVSCPCALVISVPLSFFCGIGGASRRGILIKGGSFMEALTKVRTLVFDKTGTLTEGVFEVTAVHPTMISERELLHLAAHVERHSTHPIAASLKAAYTEEQDGCCVEQVTEVAGRGVRAVVNGHMVCVGNAQMMSDLGADFEPCEKVGTIVHVALDGTYAGHIVISDRVKAEAVQAVDTLQRRYGLHTVMLTGDNAAVAADVAQRLGIGEHHAELLPTDKVEHLGRLVSAQRGGSLTAFVGDGINDAPVLARADVGIAMGAMGADAAIEAADVVLMDDNPQKIATAISLSHHTLCIARENVVFALAVKLAVLLLASVGLAGMSAAVFADVGVTVLAVLNAMRALRPRQC